MRRVTRGRPVSLPAALSDGCLVRYSVRYEPGNAAGYVLSVGPRWVAFARVADGCRWDGVEGLPRRDVVRRERAPNAEFVEEALRLAGGGRPPDPRLDVTSVAELVRSAGASFPVVAIHREVVSPGTCRIGRVVDVDRTHVTLLEIGPDAKWDTEPTRHALAEVTRVSAGDAYMRALLLVGGPPPSDPREARPRSRRRTQRGRARAVRRRTRR